MEGRCELRRRRGKATQTPVQFVADYDDSSSEDEEPTLLESTSEFATELVKDVTPYVPAPRLMVEYTRQTYRQICGAKLTYCLGFLACLLVVFVVALMVAVLANTPVVFLRLSELQNGEIDLRMMTESHTGRVALNYTRIMEVVEDHPVDAEYYRYATPRKHLRDGVAGFVDPNTCRDPDTGSVLDPTDEVWRYFGTSPFYYGLYAREDDIDVPANETVIEGSLSAMEDAMDMDMDGEMTTDMEGARANVTDTTGDNLLSMWPGESAAPAGGRYSHRGGVIEEDLDGKDEDCSRASLKCFKDMCNVASYHGLYLWDSAQEEKVGIGRDFKKGDIPYGMIRLKSDAAKKLNATEGDTIFLFVDLYWALQGVFNETATEFLLSQEGAAYSFSDIVRWRSVVVPVQVYHKFSDVKGKLDNDEESFGVMEYRHFLPLMLEHLSPEVPETFRSKLASIDLYQHASEILWNYPPEERWDLYISSLGDVNERLIDWAGQLTYRLGFQNVELDLNILEMMNILQLLNLFLGLILNVIVFILLFLSVLLIYSLLMVSVETRTFEMGIMRMVGMTRAGVVHLVLTQAFSYSLPAVLFGLALAEVGAKVASYYFLTLTGIPIDANLDMKAIVIGTFFGQLIPVISSLLPISSALGKNLHDSIDTRRSKTKAVDVQIERSEDAGVPWSTVILGIGLGVFGFSVYYVIPLSLLSENLSLLLNVFFMLLIMIILGLVLLSMNLQFLLERALVGVLLWWDKAAVISVVLKNLVAHRLRNRKTSIMYALSVGFIIFIVTSYQVQIDSVLYQSKQTSGSLLKIYTADPLPREVMQALEHWAHKSHFVNAFTWNTASLKTSLPSVSKEIEMSNIGHVFRDRVYVYGIAPNFYDVVLPGFLVVGEMEGPEASLLYQLYTPEGSSSGITGALYQSYLGLKHLHSQFLLEIEYSGQKAYFERSAELEGTHFSRLQVLAFLESSVNFKFSKFPTRKRQDVLVSLPTFIRLSGGTYKSLHDIPMAKFYVDMGEYADDDEALDIVKSEMSSILSDNDVSARLYDFRHNLDPIEKANLAVTFFFGFTIVVAMAISFFSLMSSMYTNIQEQRKEIGVLRAIGIPRGWMQRIYIYESFILVLSSSTLGVMIGVFVGWTVSMQRVLFTELPLPFQFPWELFLVVFAMSLAFSLISSWGPIWMLLREPVVSLMR